MDTQLPYTGKEFLDSLDDGREVWIYGERITNISSIPLSAIPRGCWPGSTTLCIAIMRKRRAF